MSHLGGREGEGVVGDEDRRLVRLGHALVLMGKERR